ncbi:MAG: DUF5060 domain-containing protein, partial [Nitrospirales bacterium]
SEMLHKKGVAYVDQISTDIRSSSPSVYKAIHKSLNVMGPIGLSILSYVLMLVVVFSYMGQEPAQAAASIKELNDPVPQYGTFVLQFSASSVTGWKFKKFPQVTFTKGSSKFKVEGFFNGDGNGNSSGTLWLARFMPNAQGTWNYSWSFEGSSGTGSFFVGPRTNSKNHGHVKRDGKFLKHDDGTGFHFRGANWPSAINLRESTNVVNGSPRFSDNEWVNYVNRLEQTGHNGSWMANIGNMINNDRASFDLKWMKRVDWAIETAGKRGLYMFLSLFNLWGRSEHDPFEPNIDSSKQLLDPFNGSRHREAKEFFFRYVSARYAGYFNVMWELGNEMDNTLRFSNNVSGFISASNTYYIPWIRQYDPYDLPITLSEDKKLSTKVSLDIDGHHQHESFPFSQRSRPGILTEIVNDVASGATWQTNVCNNPTYRSHYRRVIWKFMADGGSGSIECSIMFFGGIFNNSLTKYLADGNIRNVMEDHGRMGTFMANLPLEMFEMPPTGGIGSSHSSYKTRGKVGQAYMAYFYNLGTSQASITLNLDSGAYQARWFSPSLGTYSSAKTVKDGDKISSPFSNQKDVALELVSIPEDTTAPASPVGLFIK